MTFPLAQLGVHITFCELLGELHSLFLSCVGLASTKAEKSCLGIRVSLQTPCWLAQRFPKRFLVKYRQKSYPLAVDPYWKNVFFTFLKRDYPGTIILWFIMGPALWNYLWTAPLYCHSHKTRRDQDATRMRFTLAMKSSSQKMLLLQSRKVAYVVLLKLFTFTVFREPPF